MIRLPRNAVPARDGPAMTEASPFRPPRATLAGLGTIGLLALLVVLHVALFPRASLITDSGRDLANAWAVAHGGPYPSYGPGLFGHWKLGPVWYWILALPLKLGGSIRVTAAFVGVLSAAKIPFAFLLGRRMIDARFGLLLAILISLPGWDSVGTLVIAHTSVVESTMLATFWCSLVAWQARRAGFALAACLMLALALHAHPTALIAAPAVALALWRTVVAQRRWDWLLACGAAGLLPFLPPLLAEAQSGWPQWHSTLSYLQDASLWKRLARLPEVLWALISGGAWFAGRFLLPPFAAAIWWLAHGVLVGLAMLGALRLLRSHPTLAESLRPARAWLIALTPASLLAMVFIVALRDATPSWMVYCLAPFGTALLATGWHGLLWQRQLATPAIALLGMAVLLVNFGQLQARAGFERAGQVLLPGGSVGNITQWRSGRRTDTPWLAAHHYDALARMACRESEPLVLHGSLAMSFDFGQGVAARLHCAPDRLPRLSDHEGARHLLGIPLGLAQQLGLEPAPQRFGHVLRTPRQLLSPTRGRVADIDVRYRIDRQAELDAGGNIELHGQARCAPGEWLVLSNLMPLVNRFEASVQRDGERVPAVRATVVSQYYACDGGPFDWQVRTPDPASIDLVVITNQADGTDPGS